MMADKAETQTKEASPGQRDDAPERKPVSRLQDVEAIRAAGRGFDPAIAASALALNLLGLALPLAVLQIYDKMASTQALETLSFLGAGLVVVAVLELSMTTITDSF